MENELLQERLTREDAKQRACVFQKLFVATCQVVATLLKVVGQPTVECLPADPTRAISSYAMAFSFLILDIDQLVAIMSSTRAIQVVAYALMLVKSFYPSVSEDILSGDFPSVSIAESPRGDR